MNRMTRFLVVSICAAVCAFCFLTVYAAEQQGPNREEISIVTYYPSPYGDFDQFQANRLSIGDMDDDGKQTAGDLPKQNGQIAAAKSVIFKPQDKEIEKWAAGERGELAFSSVEGEFYYYNGDDWVAQSGNGGGYTTYGTTDCLKGYRTAYTGWALTTYVNGGGGGIVCMKGDLPHHP